MNSVAVSDGFILDSGELEGEDVGNGCSSKSDDYSV